jgi:hypothetical protein
MNCELAHERIVLAVYGELADDAAHELDRHIATCATCAAERQQVQALRVLADAHHVAEPDPNLMARSRIRLEEMLDAIPPKRWYERLLEKLRNNAASLQHAPIAAVLLLVAGGGAGSLGGYYVAQSHAAKTAEKGDQGVVAQPDTTPVEVASISSIVREPNSEFVHVRYNKIVPEEISGSLDDLKIRDLLMLAMENANNAGIRDDSVGLLAAECRAGHGCTGTGIRAALIVALRYDRSAAVREKALEGLQPYVAQDMGVRDAVLESLLNDSDARIRANAINILVPVEADTSVRQVLQSVAATDRNPQIRLVSRQVLRQVPVIQ